jgi:hypothetical protein
VIPPLSTAARRRTRRAWVACAMLAGFAVAFACGRALAHGGEKAGASPATTTFRIQAVGVAARPLATRPAPGRALAVVAAIPALAPAPPSPPAHTAVPPPAPASPPAPTGTRSSPSSSPKPLPAPPPPPPPVIPVFHEHS